MKLFCRNINVEYKWGRMSNLIVSGLWNVACGWARMFGKSQKSSPRTAESKLWIVQQKHQLLIQMGAYVKSDLSGLWNVAGGWAQMFGKSWIADSNIINIINTVLLTSLWGQVIWNVVGRWPLCSPCLHPAWRDLQANRNRREILGKIHDPRWRTNF